jgi:metal-responsive CopG/Arc/MetJ family transcriptional regulator
MGAISIRLPDDLEARLDSEARLEGCPRSEFVRQMLADSLERREKERFMNELVAEARAVYSDPEMREEALAIAEEGVATSNKALSLAEGNLPGGSPSSEEPDEDWWR